MNWRRGGIDGLGLLTVAWMGLEHTNFRVTRPKSLSTEPACFYIFFIIAASRGEPKTWYSVAAADAERLTDLNVCLSTEPNISDGIDDTTSKLTLIPPESVESFKIKVWVIIDCCVYMCSLSLLLLVLENNTKAYVLMELGEIHYCKAIFVQLLTNCRETRTFSNTQCIGLKMCNINYLSFWQVISNLHQLEVVSDVISSTFVRNL